MRRIAIIPLLAIVAAALASPAFNGLEIHSHISEDDSPTGDPNYGRMGFVGPRIGVENNAVLDVPNEPTGNYNTLLRREVLPYGASNPWHDPQFLAIFTHYDASLCGRMCSSVTKEAKPTYPFTHEAVPVCNMFVAYELQTQPDSLDEIAGQPVSMVCELYSSVWSSHYQSVREVAGFVAGQKAMLGPAKVSIYDREDYAYPPICAMRDACREDYYAGGDCSGWGEGYC
ncbi:hypothetical protein VMCG_09052 [Cytospora schulzeri]|uniref:Uncharacterized protein n=1 Tax=Cytospora schulzeri TaxID=448051 RepID=A0A423VP29_9PEZI|nr:hypothetical protein VMCG_09052 [Valsa malicola]